MKLLDVLKKLGVVRVGSVSGTYKSYQEMPDELMYDNVYDKKTDLMSKQDYKDVKVVYNNQKTKTIFFILMLISIIVFLFFCLMIDFNSWFLALLVFLIFFIFKLIKYKNGSISFSSIVLSFIFYFVMSIIAVVVAIPSNNNPASLENNNASVSINDVEWIDYTGAMSSVFTFRYPKTYEVQDSGTSVLLFVDKAKDYDYHLTFSVVDGVVPVSKDCEGLAKAVIAAYPGSEVRYAKNITVGSSIGCEYGVNIVKDGAKIFEISRNFNTEKQTYYITSYSKKLADLDVLTKVMDGLQLK